MKPYFCSDDGAVRVFHAPWEDVVSAGAVPVDEVALIHADPPYGNGRDVHRDGDRKNGGRVGRVRFYKPIHGNDRPFDPAPLLALNRPAVLWGANHYADKLPPSPAWLTWDKREDFGSDNGSDSELAWCTPGNVCGYRVRTFRHLWRGLARASEKNGATGPGHAGAHLHPTQKPIALCAWVFGLVPLRRGQLVFVPYAGSGPELPAAVSMGLRVIACEVEREYCDAAIGRLSAVTAERAAEPCGPLFGGSP